MFCAITFSECPSFSRKFAQIIRELIFTLAFVSDFIFFVLLYPFLLAEKVNLQFTVLIKPN